MIEFTIPIQTVSGMNAREHYMARARRVKRERESVAWWVARRTTPATPCTVTLTRLAPSNGLDDDNLASSMKGVRDELARWIGIDDRSALVQWRYEQARSKVYGVIVRVAA